MFTGAIIAWSGAILNIPVGWSLCDGSNGTPDLRNRMLIGAGDTYIVGATGGSSTHTHNDTFAIANSTAESSVELGAEDVDVCDISHSHVISGGVSSGSSLNPYYSLAYIMKT